MSNDLAGAGAERSTDPDRDGGATDFDPVAVLKHRRFTRWTHWINFPLLTIMIWSGLRIYWADVRDPYGFGVGLIGWHWFNFLPDSINDYFELDRKLAAGMAWHFTFGWLFAINGIAYGIYTWRSGEWRHLLPDRYSAGDSVEVVKLDLFIRTKPLPPQGRYNGAQRITYTLVILMGALAILSGLAIYKQTQLSPLTFLFGGYEFARSVHFAICMLFIAFFVVHLLQVARAGWGNLMSMVTGYARVRPRRSAATTITRPEPKVPESIVEVTSDV
jgi:thiosulfate reductase cytochrome b subunit